MRFVRLAATAGALLLALAGLTTGKIISVSKFRSDGESIVLVNGKRVQAPGKHNVDGVKVDFMPRGDASGASCAHSSVIVSSGDSDGAASVSVEEDTSCDDAGLSDNEKGDGMHTRTGSRSPSQHGPKQHFTYDGSQKSARSSMRERFGRLPHRDVLDRRFFDVEDLLHDFDDDENDEDEMLPTRRRGPRPGDHTEHKSSSGTGSSGGKHEAEIRHNGAYAHASASGGGPHHESVTIQTKKDTSRTSTSASASASASSSS